MERFVSHSEQETEAFAQRFARRLDAGSTLAFRGGLGAGKTAFVRGLAHGLGCSDAVSSPTFAIVQEYYGGRLPLFHFDWYRITDLNDLYSTGFFEYLDRGGVCAIEWSERVPSALPEDAVFITMTPSESPETRLITIESGARTD